MVEDRVERLRWKLGELRCMVEFEVAERMKGVGEKGKGKLKVAGRYDGKGGYKDKVEEPEISSIVK